MTHSTADNLYDIEVKDKEVREDRTILKIETEIDGEIYRRNFTFQPRHFNEAERWKKHVKQWIDQIHDSEVADQKIDTGVTNVNN